MSVEPPRDADGNTPLHNAAKKGSAELCLNFIEAGAGLEYENNVSLLGLLLPNLTQLCMTIGCVTFVRV
jgi:hypothetical protein